MRSLREIVIAEYRGRPARPDEIATYLGPEYKPGRAWCAGFVAWCLMSAGYEAPYAGPARRGARALVKWLAADSGWLVAPGTRKPDLSVIRPGDVVCWRRVRIGWQCHVAVVIACDDKTITVMGGNEGGRVRGRRLSRDKFCQHLRGLYGVVRPRMVKV